MNYRIKTILPLLFFCLFFSTAPLYAINIDPQQPSMLMYRKTPVTLSASVPPAVMLTLDTSVSMLDWAYDKNTSFDSTKEYYGLFNPKYYYTYDRNKSHQFFKNGSEKCSPHVNCTDIQTCENGRWSGNFLNWLTMRRIDIAKKILTGGRVAKAENFEHSNPTYQGDVITAETSKLKWDGHKKSYNDTHKKTDLNGNRCHMTPYHKDIEFKFKTDSTKRHLFVEVPGKYPWIRARRQVPENELPIEGIVQETASDIRYGFTIFNATPCPGVNRRKQGGIVKQHIGAPTNDIVDTINANHPLGGTPAAETLYTVAGYFAQEKENKKENLIGETKWKASSFYGIDHLIDDEDTVEKKLDEGYVVSGCTYYNKTSSYDYPYSVGPRYNANNSYQINNEWDPFYIDGKFTPCSKSFIILLSDGAPSEDRNIPKTLQTYRTGNSTRDYLGNVAYYARHTKLKPGNDKIPEESQYLTLYSIYTFGDSQEALDTLAYASKQGGFEDKDDNGVVDDSEAEIDPRSKLPKNCFHATSGDEIAEALLTTLNDIQKSTSASSGTAVAIPGNSVDGSGATFQSVFFPARAGVDGAGEDEKEVVWTGNVQALFIDAYGNLREDTLKNQQLDMVDDLIIQTTSKNGTVSVSTYKDLNGNGLLEKNEDLNGNGKLDPGEDLNGNGKLDTYDEPVVDTGISLDAINWLWDGGDRLAKSPNTSIHQQRSSYLTATNKRYLYTYFDKDNDGKVDSGEYQAFTESLADNNDYIGWFLGTDTGDIRNFNDDITVDKDDLKILINYIRGKDDTNNPRLRPRQYNGKTWRLGDIIHSSPVAVQAPFAGYDITYNDKSYRKFKRAYSDRRTMVYTGSNDGIFHAFNGGFYQKEYTDTDGNSFQNKFWKHCAKDDNGTLTCNDSGTGAIPLGQEMWGYIPQNLLPHLQWLPQKNYSHIYYNDLPPFTFEAQLWPEDDPVHIGGWGTLLIGGMRFGGGPIEVNINAFKNGNGNNGNGNGNATDKRIMRSAYFLMDITNPELPPVLLDEFAIDTDDRASFTTVQPSLEYVTKDDDTREWFLVFGTGPTTLKGESKQKAKVFISKLPSLAGYGQGQSGSPSKDIIDTSSWEREFEIEEENSFISDFHGSDFQVGSSKGAFTTDAIYFGTVAGDKDNWTGKVHRIVVQGGTNKASITTSWVERVLFDAKAPISVKPQVSLDNHENVWVYFGTGRFYAPYDKENTAPNKLYGIKEPMQVDGDLGNIPAYNGSTTEAAVKEKELLNTTNTEVYAGTSAAVSTVKTTSAISVTTDATEPGATNFADLEDEADGKQGWVVGLSTKEEDGELKGTGERLIANPVIRNQVANFNTFTPSDDICKSASKGAIYDFYYKTGTAFWKPIMGADKNKTVTVTVDEKEKKQKLSITKKTVDTSITSSAFQSGEGGVKQIVQKGDGSTENFSIKTPGKNRSGRIYWEDRRY